VPFGRHQSTIPAPSPSIVRRYRCDGLIAANIEYSRHTKRAPKSRSNFMSKDNMSKDSMSKDSMSKDSMKKDMMKKDDMKK
jgi:pentapeptide MXKDX repeat protein